MRDVAGKTAFITGGGSGVGFGLAQAFTAAGMNVVIADLRQDHLDEAMNGLPSSQAHSMRLDVTDRAAMAAAAQETERVFGKVHVLCNNAGVNLFNDIGAASYDDWDWILGVNLGGVVNGIQSFVPRIKAHGEGGHVVNTASMAAFIASARPGIYCVSKFAVRGLSQALRGSLAHHRIGVSVLCPGLVKSAIHESERNRPAHLMTGAKPTDPQFLERLAEVHQVGMPPEEVGAKVLRGIRRNDFYIFTHPEFKEELRALFDEVLQALPDEPVPPERLEFEEGRRTAAQEDRASWPKLV